MSKAGADHHTMVWLTHMTVMLMMLLTRNSRAQVRAGESESETQDEMLTNPVWKQSGMAGLSARGKVQVRTTGALRHSTLAAAKHKDILYCNCSAVHWKESDMAGLSARGEV